MANNSRLSFSALLCQITLFGSCLACFLIYKRIPSSSASMQQLREAAKRSTQHRRSGLAQIIEGLRVDSILHPRKSPYTTHLENEDCMSSSSSCCSGSGGSLTKSSANSLYSGKAAGHSTHHHTRSAYPAPKNAQIWSQINRIE